MGNEKLDKIEANSAQINEMVAAILTDKLVEIDGYMDIVRTCFLSDKEVSDADLNRIILQIPTYLYNLCAIAQEIEMKKGVAKETAAYAKNEALLNATGTVQEKSSRAENLTIEDRFIELAYKTAAAVINKKIDGAIAILDSAKKVQAQRLKEKQLTNVAGNAVGGSAF